MKKLMIAAAVAVLGIAANAASFNWAGKGNWVDATTGAVLTSGTAPAGTFVLCYIGGDSPLVVNEGSATFKTSMGSPVATVAGKFTLDGTSYKDGDIFKVMFRDGDNNLKDVIDQASGEVLTATYTIAGYKDSSSTLDDYQFASANFAVQSVPEPTSGLLLLLGVAGMALRRRRA